MRVPQRLRPFSLSCCRLPFRSLVIEGLSESELASIRLACMRAAREFNFAIILTKESQEGKVELASRLRKALAAEAMPSLDQTERMRGVAHLVSSPNVGFTQLVLTPQAFLAQREAVSPQLSPPALLTSIAHYSVSQSCSVVDYGYTSGWLRSPNSNSAWQYYPPSLKNRYSPIEFERLDPCSLAAPNATFDDVPAALYPLIVSRLLFDQSDGSGFKALARLSLVNAEWGAVALEALYSEDTAKHLAKLRRAHKHAVRRLVDTTNAASAAEPLRDARDSAASQLNRSKDGLRDAFIACMHLASPAAFVHQFERLQHLRNPDLRIDLLFDCDDFALGKAAAQGCRKGKWTPALAVKLILRYATKYADEGDPEEASALADMCCDFARGIEMDQIEILDATLAAMHQVPTQFTAWALIENRGQLVQDFDFSVPAAISIGEDVARMKSVKMPVVAAVLITLMNQVSPPMILSPSPLALTPPLLLSLPNLSSTCALVLLSRPGERHG